MLNQAEQVLLEKIRNLPPNKVMEVEDFVDFLLERTQDRQLVAAATKFSEKLFCRVWDNSEDADYDQLYVFRLPARNGSRQVMGRSLRLGLLMSYLLVWLKSQLL